ncbi:unnamed protein product, partial [Sphenostylis stenocarpa]
MEMKKNVKVEGYEYDMRGSKVETKCSFKSDVNVGVRWNIAVVADDTFFSPCLVDGCCCC